MKFFVDECFPRSFVRALSDRGYDVVWARLVCPSAEDRDILRRATSDARVVVTEDRDFGTLVYKEGEPALGIVAIYARQFPGGIKYVTPQLADQLTQLGEHLVGRFTVIEPGRVRTKDLPR